MNNFHPLEVVGPGSETQLQVGDNLNYLNYVTEYDLCVEYDFNYLNWGVEYDTWA